MASSVLSERAFCQGGITISKRRNRLKGDIVEALQCIKCAIRHDLLFCEAGPSSLSEEETDEYEVEDDLSEQQDDGGDEEGWEGLFLEEDENDLESDVEMDQDN
jgi:hypothetical protein